MKIIVVGAGDVGAYMCQVLSEAGNEVTLVESVDSVADDIEERLDVRVIRGNGASAKYLKRAGLDYWHFVDISYYDGIEELFAKYPDGNYWFFSTKSAKTHSDVRFAEGDFLVFGRETAGLDESLLAAHYENCVRIPMIGEIRSLNLSNSVAVAVYEGWRQLGYENGSRIGKLRSMSSGEDGKIR